MVQRPRPSLSPTRSTPHTSSACSSPTPRRSAASSCRTPSLSLAISREGRNARLAAKLTGWKIDIKSQTQMEELMREQSLRDAQALDEYERGDDGDETAGY